MLERRRPDRGRGRRGRARAPSGPKRWCGLDLDQETGLGAGDGWGGSVAVAEAVAAVGAGCSTGSGTKTGTVAPAAAAAAAGGLSREMISVEMQVRAEPWPSRRVSRAARAGAGVGTCELKHAPRGWRPEVGGGRQAGGGRRQAGAERAEGGGGQWACGLHAADGGRPDGRTDGRTGGCAAGRRSLGAGRWAPLGCWAGVCQGVLRPCVQRRAGRLAPGRSTARARAPPTSRFNVSYMRHIDLGRPRQPGVRKRSAATGCACAPGRASTSYWNTMMEHRAKRRSLPPGAWITRSPGARRPNAAPLAWATKPCTTRVSTGTAEHLFMRPQPAGRPTPIACIVYSAVAVLRNPAGARKE